MVLRRKLIGHIEIKSDGDVFHELFRHRPHHISHMSPQKVQSVDLHHGQWEGKAKGVKCILERIDEAKKSVTFNVIEGDISELYTTFKSTVHIDTNGEYNIVTWTIEYERKKEDVPDPISYLEFALYLTRDIEAHHLK